MTERKEPTPAIHESQAVYPAPDSCSYAVSRYKGSRHWAIRDPSGSLVCVALYKKGAQEVARRLNAAVREEKEPKP
jgi:hypothetical protein